MTLLIQHFHSKPELRLTKKAWNRFTYHTQRHLLKKFDVILLDHSTKKEIITRMLKSFNQKNLDSGINQFKKGMDEFSKEMEKLHDSLDDGKRVDLKDFWGANDKTVKDQVWGKRSNNTVW